MISGHGTIETAVRATKLGAFDFIEKPLSLEKIIVLVRNAIQQRRLEEENQLLRSELGHRYQVIGESVPMKALRQQIAVTAPTNGRVLIYGESGTGKELVARSLHAASLRSKGPFVEVNCAAIPEELIESELFGHVKGSFTGAAEDKIGKFKKADGGTLVPRRNRRHEPAHAIQSVARARRAALRAGRLEPDAYRGRARARRHQQESRARNRPRRVSSGSVLPPERNSLFCAAAARSQGRYSHSRALFPERIQLALTERERAS